MTETFYDLLGVPADADTPAIERAYRQRIKETHPDLNDDPDASEQTARIVEARDVLTDADERARYDRLGHDAYVGGGFSSPTEPGTATGPGNDGWQGSAAEAARDVDATSGPTNDRASAEERRRRERRASRDVDFGADEDPSSTGGATTTTSGGSATATNGGTAAATNGGTATGATASGGTGDGGNDARRTAASAEPPSWSDTSQGWAARAPTAPAPGLVDQTYAALADAPGTAIVAFALYPLLVFGTFLPAFPLFVNVIVAVCLIAMIGAAQSVPGLGVAIFGGWTILGTVGLIVAGTTPFGPLGLIVLGTTWLPLGFSVLTYQALDT